MIIRNARKRSRLIQPLLVFGTFTLLVAVAAGIYALAHTDPEAPAEFHCDAEDFTRESDRAYFKKGDIDFFNGQTRDQEHARSGKFSSRVDKDAPYGIGFETLVFEPGDVIEISVWVHSEFNEGELIVDCNWGLYRRERGGEGNRAIGWEEISTIIKIPYFVEDPKIKAYAYNPEEIPAWFDDMRIRKVQRAREIVYPEFVEDSLPVMNLIIGEKGMSKLTAKREAAFKRGMLRQGDDDWISVKLEVAEGQIPAKARLKGDWTDHLRGEKWSFRIQTQTGFAWNRLITFSIQNPETRSWLDEWVFHKLLHAEDVLAPRYDFIHVQLNGKPLGVYAFEEHFVKQLPEFNSRREGPIVRFNEEGFWDVIEVQENTGVTINHRLPIIQSANITTFKEARTLGDSTLRRQFEIAAALMNEFHYGLRPVTEIFDRDKLARYLAMIDVNHAHHGFIWHNTRFYYNPVTSRLEPIGFDGFTAAGPLTWINRPFIGHGRNIRHMDPDAREMLFEKFFLDEEFVETYVHYLVKYTDPEFIDRFMRQLGPQLDHRERMIRKEWSDYRYDRKFLTENARNIRRILFPFPETSVKAHIEKQNGNKLSLKVFNFHCLPVHLVGIGNSRDAITAKFPENPRLEAFAGHLPPEYTDLEISGNGKFIYFTVPGMDSLFQAALLPWRSPEIVTPEQELFTDLKIQTNDLFVVNEEEKTVYFRAGTHQTDKDILIPPGYLVRIGPGTTIDLVRKAKFISKSAIIAGGREDAPVTFTSSDKTGNGVTILQAAEKSTLREVIFDNLNTMAYKGWGITGAVTFYESEVDIESCAFVNNHCEDALNIVRSKFELRHSRIGNTFGDGFDCDFCEGTVIRTDFVNTGNDAMDFSGSHIVVIDCDVEGAGDKGLSAGEESRVTVESMKVKNAVMGAVAKDLTILTIKHIDLEQVGRGFAAYKKKPEYGGATITVETYTASGVETLHTIETGSLLQLGDIEIKGDK